MRELSRHRAMDSFVIRRAQVEPVSSDVAAAHTSEKRRSQRSERSSQTPKAVTASGTKFSENGVASAVKSAVYFETFWSYARSAARAGVTGRIAFEK